MNRWQAGIAAALVAVSCAAHSQVTVKRIQTDSAAIATGVWAGDTFYLSGQVASPLNEGKGTPEYGDTRAQAASIFAKIQKLLQAQGLDMKDVVHMTVMLGPDPKTGKLDFAGMQSEYVKYFGTRDQPNKPARSAFQAAALAAPWALLEVEVTAVRSK
ncbi:MAG TPA: Rid family hydrolase [Acidobacteriaceae bacterium]|jgi:enamine deaminase RidA (YjgF/YER057c/UK114 family)